MKPLLSCLITACAATGLVVGQTATTKPVGYVTETFPPNQFTLFGLTLHEPLQISGVGLSPTAQGNNTILAKAGIGSGLQSGQTYIIEFISGAYEGVSQDFITYSENSITIPGNYSAVSAQDSFSIRRAKTIADIFGSSNSAGLQPGTSATADILWVSNSDGTYSRYYYAAASPPFVTAGWKLVGGGDTDRSNVPLVYLDGMLIERKASTELNLTISGEVKLTKFVTSINGGQFNPISAVFPAGTTLTNSGLASFVVPGTSATADIIWVPNGSGYSRYYYAAASPPFVTAGWKLVGGGDTNRGGDSLKSGILLERKGSTANLTFTPPVGYSGL